MSGLMRPFADLDYTAITSTFARLDAFVRLHSRFGTGDSFSDKQYQFRYHRLVSAELQRLMAESEGFYLDQNPQLTVT